MGIFSTKKKHVVNTTVTRLIDDADIYESIPSSTISSIMKDDDQLVENILEGLIAGIGSRAQRMYTYADTYYTYGRPSSQYKSADYGADVVEARIKTLFGATAVVDYYQFGPLNNLHDGWMHLVADYGYQSSTNTLETLSIVKGSPVYLKDMVVVFTQASFDELGINGLARWGLPPNAGITPTRSVVNLYGVHSPNQVDPTALVDSVLVTYQWVSAGAVQEESIYIPFNPLILDEDYFQVKYTVNGEAGYWAYQEGAGTYAELDALFNSPALPFGNYFPFAYFRYNNTSMGADITSEGYKTSKRLVKYLGIDYDTMIASIHENPDIDSVEQAMLMMAVPATSNHQMDQRYLFDFFKKVSTYSNNTIVSNTATLLSYQTNTMGEYGGGDIVVAPPRLNWTIQDNRFKMVVACDGIYRRTKAGVVAPVGDYARELRQVTYSFTYLDPSIVDEFGEKVPQTGSANLPSYFFRHQVSASSYEEIEVVYLQTRYHVWGGLTTVGDETDPTLLIPLDYEITSQYNLPTREVLYARSLHLVFNSHQIIKIKWYQTLFFRFLILVVAIVVTVLTYGSTWEAAIAAAASMSAGAIAMAVLMAILKYIIITLLIRLFVKAVGVEVAFIVAIVAALFGMYQAIDAGSVAGAPWASELLSLSTGLTSEIGNTIQADLLDLRKEAEAFSLFAEEQTKLLETANELLETSTLLSPMVIFGESPNDFYNRTVHSGNIGLVGIDAVASYVDVALTLPSLPDTLGYNA